MHQPFVPLAVLALVISPLAASDAWAQSADQVAQAAAPEKPAAGASQQPSSGRTPPGIEEIVVQAGESESAKDIQAGDSVTGFNASDLQALGAQSIEDLAGFTPNLEIVTAGATTPTFFIRGVGLNDFNPNSSGAVAIYQDDVPKNSPALQLGTLFDIESVNILRGPQGTGSARNASAGAIKIYSRKPTGSVGGYLRSDIGNYNARDFEGAVEAPLFEDILSTRLAFRYSQRDGTVTNRCGSNPRTSDPLTTARSDNTLVSDGGHSVCGETVYRMNQVDLNRGGPVSDGFSRIPPGLPSKVNDQGVWATRGILRFQPTLDQDWLLTVNVSQRDELARLGQQLGTSDPSYICDLDQRQQRPGCVIPSFGSRQGGGNSGSNYMSIEMIRLRNRLNPCFANDGNPNGTVLPTPECNSPPPPGQSLTYRDLVSNQTRLEIARSLVQDPQPFVGDYDRVGKITNDVWGASVKGDIALGDSLTLTTVSAYDTYKRFNDLDLDFSPDVLFEIVTADRGWQAVEDVKLSGVLSKELPINWDLGGFTLFERLDAQTDILLPSNIQTAAVSYRDWTQKLWSGAGYLSFDWDFWDDFTLDGGVRYNWEAKSMDMFLLALGQRPEADRLGQDTRQSTNLSKNRIWQAPTGTIRLTYRFREDIQAFLKYTRGWKGGHFNTTVSAGSDITVGEPETIDSFEGGLKGSWLNGRLGLTTSLFHYAYQDYQIFTVIIPLNGTPEFVVLNASDAEVYGGELELTARPITGMFLQGRVSWLESQFLDFVQKQARSQQVGNRQVVQIRELDFSGNRLLNSPQYKLSLTAEQTLPLGRYGSLTFRWDGAWTADTYYDASEGKGTPTFDGVYYFPNNTIGQAAYWLHNFSLAYRTPDGRVELSAWVRNATDEVYKTFAFDASALLTNSTTIYFLGDPRTYGLSLTATF